MTLDDAPTMACRFAYDGSRRYLRLRFYVGNDCIGDVDVSVMVLDEGTIARLTDPNYLRKWTALRFGYEYDTGAALIGEAIKEFNRLRWFHERTYDKPELSGTVYAPLRNPDVPFSVYHDSAG